MSPSAPPTVLTAENLSVERSGHCVLNDLGFSIKAGESIAIVGPNGAGKTTLMLTMLGLLKPSAGRVLLNGRPIDRFADRKSIARQIAYVPQQYEGFTGFTVYDMVSAGRYAHQGPFAIHTGQDRRIIASALEACGLAELQDRIVSQLSGGERQKVWLAAAMAQQSPILFLDEPTTALDPKHQTELVALLRQLHESGNTLVVICHDLNLAIALESRVLALRGGELLYDEPMGDFLNDEHLRQVFATQFEQLQTSIGQARILPRV